jgi:hypothetical protein
MIEADIRIPVLDPIAFTTSPNIVISPIIIPPNIAAVGMYNFNFEYTDSVR